MPKVNIYIPDAVYREIKRRKLPISQVVQRALTRALAEDENASWIADARRRPTHGSSLTTGSVMSAVGEEFGA